MNSDPDKRVIGDGSGSALQRTYRSGYLLEVLGELRSSKYNNSVFILVLRCIVMAFHYVVKSAIFEITVFAVASIVGCLVVYRWFRGGED
ncbi:MAG TPA: hypothetical protein VFY68_00440 [Nitrososphaeraceae archaeon]|nr:hypothetical protein [Nitrososphaeraceae archaeon]